MRAAIAWLLALILILGLVQVWLPRALAGRLEAGLRQELTSVGSLVVELRARPAVAALWGRFHRIRVVATDIVVNGLPIAAFELDGEGLQLDVGRLYVDGVVDIKYGQRLVAAVTLTEEDINRYMWEQIDPERRLSISLQAGLATLTGSINFFGRAIELRLEGVFQRQDDTKLVFMPNSLALEQLEVPPVILNAFLEHKTLLLDLAALPVPLILDQVQVSEGRLLVTGHYTGLVKDGG